MTKDEKYKMFAEDESFEDSLDSIDWKKQAASALRIEPKALRGRKKIGEKISITLEKELIERLKTVSSSKGIGYQTMIRYIINEKLGDYEKTAK